MSSGKVWLSMSKLRARPDISTNQLFYKGGSWLPRTTVVNGT
jgi:hypothetical protein